MRHAAQLKLLVALATTVLAFSSQANAQKFPNRPMTMVIPFAAGGPTDILGRVVAGRAKNTPAWPWWGAGRWATRHSIEATASAINSHPARPAGCAFYEVDPQSGATIEMFYADRERAQAFGSRAAGRYWRKCGCSPGCAEWSVHCLLRYAPRCAGALGYVVSVSVGAAIARVAVPRFIGAA
jgi:hypothetical protein